MTSQYIISDEALSALVQTIVHSLWQFSAIALAMSFLLHYHRHAAAEKRYRIALGSLILTLLVSVGTFVWLYSSGPDSGPQMLSAAIADDTSYAMADTQGLAQKLSQWIYVYRWPIFITWVAGVILYLVRFIVSLGYVEYLSRTSESLNHSYINPLFTKICTEFGISQEVRIRTSSHVHTPMILGVLKPVILMPVSLVNQLNPQEAEAILVHELAHFVRKDILVNMIQTVIEAMYYYHPAIWWISANIRVERESCCDELAVAYTGDNISYAKTLVKVQEMYLQGNAPSLALNFSKRNDSFFSNRIKRILNMTQTRNFLREKIITTCMLVAVVMLFTKNMTGSTAPANHKNTKEVEKEITVTLPDSIPGAKHESIRIQKRTNDKDVKISIENGKVTDLEVDGKKIDEKDYDKYQDLIDEMKPQSFSQGNSRMFFFGDRNGQPFEFRFGHPSDMDSIFGGLRGLEGFGFGDDAFRDHMKKLQDQLGQMKFNFDGIDNFNFNFDGLDSMKFNFGFPEGGNWQDGRSMEDFMEDYDIIMPEKPSHNEAKNFNEIIGSALNRDGLLIPNQENSIELTGKHLKINGEKQPTNLWQKYKRIFEQESGTVMQKNSRLVFRIMGKESKRKYRVY